jgi:hypothetical protein
VDRRRIHSSGSGGPWGAGDRCEAELAIASEQGLGPRRVEVHAEPQPERQHIAHGDGPDGRDGSPPSIGPRGSTSTRRVGQLGQHLVDGIVEPQLAVLEKEQAPHGKDPACVMDAMRKMLSRRTGMF